MATVCLCSRAEPQYPHNPTRVTGPLLSAGGNVARFTAEEGRLGSDLCKLAAGRDSWDIPTLETRVEITQMSGQRPLSGWGLGRGHRHVSQMIEAGSRPIGVRV